MTWRSRWPVIYVLCVTVLLYAAFGHWAYDDPFITYRYARNLAGGLGFVYNPGEPVLSTTTPLFAILLALGAWIWPDIPHLAILIGAMSTALGGVFLWDLSRTWQTEPAGWTALVLYPAFPLLVSTLGSETPLYLAFCLGGFAAYARGRWTGTAVFAALALLTRGDGALLALILGVDFLRNVRRPIPWRAVVVFLVISIPWFVFAWLYFGSPLPVTLAAKQSQGAMAISQRFAAGFLALARVYLAEWVYRLEAGLAAIGLVYAAARLPPLLSLRSRWLPPASRWGLTQGRWGPTPSRWGLLFTWTVLYFAAYWALGVSRYFWYYAPLVPGFVAAVGLGIMAIAPALATAVATVLARRSAALPGRLGQPGGRPADPARYVWALSLACLLPLALAQGKNLLDARNAADRRYGIYRAVGEWLSQNTPSSSRVGALEVGIIGYYARRPMIDFAGLIQPDIAARLTPEATYEEAALWAVEHYRPEFLVLHDGLFPRLEGDYAARQCRPLKKLVGKVYGYSSDLVIYRCS